MRALLRELERIVNDNPHKLTEHDLILAASKLRERQFIYKDRHGQGRTYDILARYEGYFANLFAAFGDEYFVDQHFGYVGILPRTPRPLLKQLETIFLLILAKMHDLECRKARSQKGRTNPSESVLLDEYVATTGRDKPKPVDTRNALERLSKAGIIELGEVNELTEMRQITILPSIVRVVTPRYLERLQEFSQLDTEETPVSELDELLPLYNGNEGDEPLETSHGN